MQDRVNPYRFSRKGYGADEWLSDKQLRIAGILGVEWYPTSHGKDENKIECPTPHICGWFCAKEDELKIKRLEATNAG